MFNTDGSYTFTPAPGFSGPVVLIYKACDGSTIPICAINTLEIIVIPAPVINVNLINPDFGVTDTNVPVNGNLTTNDQLPKGTTYGQPVSNVNNPTVLIKLYDPLPPEFNINSQCWVVFHFQEW